MTLSTRRLVAVEHLEKLHPYVRSKNTRPPTVDFPAFISVVLVDPV